MATRQSPSSSTLRPDELRHGGMVCWLFYRENRALACSISIDDDGRNGVHVTRLWDDESFSELFKRPEDALQRHAEIASFLHESGWLLVERTVVPVAA
jgi:hypothetical protein